MKLAARCSSQKPDELLLVEPGDLAHGLDSALAELRGRHPPHAPEPLDRKRMQERQLAFGRHDEQTVGLGDAARDLREELRPRDAHGQREPDLLEHPAPQASGDLHRCAGDPFHSSHVEERFVDRQPLDERRHVVKDPIHGLARLGVGREARWHHDRLRAEPASLPAAHRRLDAERLGLVARR